MSDRAAELKEILSAAKKEHAFGLALGTKDGPLVLTSASKPPEALKGVARNRVGGKAGAGRLAFEDGKMILKFVEDPPPGCLRALKGLFKEHKVPVKIALMLPDGRFDEDGPEGAEAEEGTGRDATAPTDAADPDLERLRELFARTEPQLRKAAQDDPSRAEAIGRMLAALRIQAAASPPDTAALKQLLQNAQQFLPKPGRPLSQPSPEAAALQESMRRITVDAVAAAKADPTLAGEVKSQTAAFKTAIGRQPPDLDAARGAMTALQRLLPKPARPLSQPQDAQAAPEPAAPDVGALREAMSRIAAKAKEAAGPDPDQATRIAEVEKQFSAALAGVPPDAAAARKAMMAMQSLIAKPADAVERVEARKAIAKARDTWKMAIKRTENDLVRLERTIAGVVEGMPGAGRIGKPFADMRGILAKLAEAMTEAMKGEDDLAARKAISLGKRLAGIVNSHPMLSRIDGNPFFNTQVTSWLNNALREVENTLAEVALTRG